MTEDGEIKWHVATCPECAGKGEISWKNYDGYPEYSKCSSCKGKKLVKIQIDNLEEYKP